MGWTALVEPQSKTYSRITWDQRIPLAHQHWTVKIVSRSAQKISN
jgi:hypothetical protein